MVSKTFIPLASAAALVAGFTPSGFTPASTTDLIVAYGQTAAMNGAVVDKATTASQPTIATASKLTGTSFMVIMVDLDIPSNSTPHTFLHWMQSNLSASTAAASVTSANGTVQAFTLVNTNNAAAIVNYTQPSPPAQNPLSHRYTQVIVDTSAMSAAALNTITTAAQSRVGFDVATVLQNAGLTANVVAGNSFNVTNPGPATNAAAANANAAAAANGTTAATTTAKKGGKKTKTGAAAAAQATASGGAGGGKHKGSGNAQATKSGGNRNTPSNTAAAGAAGLPAATGTTASGNLTSAAGAKNGTGTVTVSGAMGGYGFMVSPLSAVLAGLLGVFAYAL